MTIPGYSTAYMIQTQVSHTPIMTLQELRTSCKAGQEIITPHEGDNTFDEYSQSHKLNDIALWSNKSLLLHIAHDLAEYIAKNGSYQDTKYDRV